MLDGSYRSPLRRQRFTIAFCDPSVPCVSLRQRKVGGGRSAGGRVPSPAVSLLAESGVVREGGPSNRGEASPNRTPAQNSTKTTAYRAAVRTATFDCSRSRRRCRPRGPAVSAVLFLFWERPSRSGPPSLPRSSVFHPKVTGLHYEEPGRQQAAALQKLAWGRE